VASTRRNLADFELDKTLGLYRHPHANEAFSYSDGEEDERLLLNLFESTRDTSICSDTLRRERRNWTTEYHCSPARHNLLRHVHFKKNSTVLELGAGCGALTRQLGEQGVQVSAIEGSLMRSRINRVRCKGLSNVNVYVGNFGELEYNQRYDCVTLIGVLEYSRQFIEAPDPIQHVLQNTFNLLNDDGVLILAIENQLGLKYLCGYSEDHTAIPYYGIEDRYGPRSVVTFGKKELGERLQKVGFHSTVFHYPYPDYKLPRCIVTDRGMQEAGFMPGEIVRQLHSRDYSAPHLVTPIREGLVVPALTRNGLLGDLANSFLVFASRSQSAIDKLIDANLLAAHYASDRAVPYWIGTTFFRGTSAIEVKKERLAPRAVEPTRITLKHQITTQYYRPGKNLGAEFAKATLVRDYAEVSRLLSILVGFIEANAPSEPLRSERSATRIKADWIDAIPSNVILTAQGPALIDQEWVATREVTLGELVLRIIEEIALIDPDLPDTSRGGLLQLFIQHGYSFDPELLARYDALTFGIAEQVHEAKAIIK
jgi:2-polyprenyl-3-methyl-5-hydroxy-6-metoxy-1,4-benzoquinol methylase